MHPRRIELNRRHSWEMGKLYQRFLDIHPGVEGDELPMSDAEDAAWADFSAELLARHQAERAALAAQLEAEQQPRRTAPPGQMAAPEAIARVVLWIRARELEYPTEGLMADRFSVGWSVYAPVETDESDPLSFLDVPVGRAVFLIGDSGRIEESSSSVPPSVARVRFTQRELALRNEE
ncbi:hypothetical protein [Nocardia carnea]|uniref:Uncharacterized protein n=1 Tax=Nocardia carnea TaxID=37328 RepID=A0ABW7TME8_9NOCA|nr:hypothetical protein [Nocardia carnea]